MAGSNNHSRGHPSWVSGSKLAFLSQYSADWQKATDTSLVAASQFYMTITKHFIKKYGWGFDRWTDKDCLDPNPDTINDDDDDQETLTEQESTKRNEYFRATRGISDLHS